MYELVAMRASWLCDAEYLWSQHRKAALKLGITDDELDAVATGPMDPRLQGLDRAVVQAVDDLHFQHRFSDDSWTALDGPLGTDAKLDILMTHGIFIMQAHIANSTGVDLEEGSVGFTAELIALRQRQTRALKAV